MLHGWLLVTMFVKALTVLVALAAVGNAQIEYFEQPVLKWEAAAPSIGPGNAVTLSPDGAYVYATSEDGTVTRVNALDGLDPLSYAPPTGNPVLLPGSRSGVAFGTDFLVYAITDGLQTFTEECRIAKLGLDLTQMWVSDPVQGACSGDPVVSSDDAYVFINTNAAIDATTFQGTFNIMTAADGAPFYSEAPLTPIGAGPDMGTFVARPFGPIGIFKNPILGAYTGGDLPPNTNDILVWSNSLAPGEMTVGTGATWGFQFPLDGSDPAIIPFLPNPDVAGANANPTWLSNAAPVLYNGGISLVFAASRSDFFNWVGSGLARDFFDRGRTNRNSLSYETGLARAFGTTVSPTLNSDESVIYGAVTGNQLVAMNPDLTPVWEFATITPVSSKPIVAVDDSRVFFAEESGLMYSVLASGGSQVWQVPLGAPSGSDIDLSADGTTLFYGDILGNLVAWNIAGLPPTEAPTEIPSIMPSSTPPTPPTDSPSAAPSIMEAPVTRAPVSEAPSPPTEPTTLAPVSPAPVTTMPTDTSGAYTISVFTIIAGVIAAFWLL